MTVRIQTSAEAEETEILTIPALPLNILANYDYFKKRNNILL